MLPFTLDRSKERINHPKRILALTLHGIHAAMKVEAFIDRHFSPSRFWEWFISSAYIMPLTLTQYEGGNAIYDTREIRDDWTLREVIGLRTVPTSAA